MASIGSATGLIAEARGELQALLQVNDEYDGLGPTEWTDQIYQASICLRDALDHIDNAELSS